MDQVATTVAARYLKRLHYDDDHIAVLAIPRKNGTVEQRFPTAAEAATVKYQGWLRHLNANSYDIYLSVNPVNPQRRLRQKQDISQIRRLQLDLDTNGQANLKRLFEDIGAGRVPKPAHVLCSSPDHYQVLWDTSPHHWHSDQAEEVMKGLALRYNGDANVAEIARVMRWPGYRNKKPGRKNAMVTWTHQKGLPVTLPNFRNLLRDISPKQVHPPRPKTPAGARIGNSQSERDWARVRTLLKQGVSEETLARQLEAERQDKPKPAYYAQRTVSRAAASLREERSTTPFNTHKGDSHHDSGSSSPRRESPPGSHRGGVSGGLRPRRPGNHPAGYDGAGPQDGLPRAGGGAPTGGSRRHQVALFRDPVRSGGQPAVPLHSDTTGGREMADKKQKKAPVGNKYLDLHYKDFAERIISQIKAGTAPWQKPWKPGEQVLPHSLATGREYQGGNSLHLMAVAQAKGYSDPRWATFEQIKAASGIVRKGEKSTKIVWWDFSRTKEKVQVTDREGKPILNDKGEPVLHRPAPRFKVYSVFNIEQTARMTIDPVVSDKPSWKAHQDADALIKASGVKINHVQGDRAFYSSNIDAVTLPQPSQFPDATSYYHTANHELGHATGHESRMNRETLQEGLKQGFGSEAYAREELRAEIAAMMTNTRLGLGHRSMEGAAYVKSWVKVINDDPKEIHFAARDAQKISDHLIDPVRERLQQKEQKPAPEQQPEAERAAPVPAPAAPSLSDRMSAYRQSIPADHVELEARPKTDLPNGPIDYTFQGQAIPQDLQGLAKKDFGYNHVIAHAPAAEVQNHLRSLPTTERPTIETGPSR